MRYRIVSEQVMTTWYVTITTFEPDGSEIVKSKRSYSFPCHENQPNDLFIFLQQLAREVIESQD